MTVSYWQQRNDLGDLSTELVIIGAGICGVSAALEAERHGIKPILLERNELASGASGRNAGYLMRGMADTYAVITKAMGRQTARDIWRWSEENLRALREEGVESTEGYAARPSCLLAMHEGEAADLRESHRMLRDDGFDSIQLEAGGCNDPVWVRGRPRLGLVNPGDAVCHPVAMLGMLASKLKTTERIERCQVLSLEREDAGVVVRTGRGNIRAKRVLLCTNAQAAELVPAMRGIVVPKRGQMLAARPKGDPVKLEYSYYFNRGNEYLRSGPNGELLMGGARALEPADEAGDHPGTNSVVQARLEAWIRQLVTDQFVVISRWSGVMGFSPDGLPLVGPAGGAAGQGERVWVCAGFTGHGMSLGFLAAKRACAALLDAGEAPKLFAMNRQTLTQRLKPLH